VRTRKNSRALQLQNATHACAGDLVHLPGATACKYSVRVGEVWSIVMQQLLQAINLQCTEEGKATALCRCSLHEKKLSGVYAEDVPASPALK